VFVSNTFDPRLYPEQHQQLSERNKEIINLLFKALTLSQAGVDTGLFFAIALLTLKKPEEKPYWSHMTILGRWKEESTIRSYKSIWHRFVDFYLKEEIESCWDTDEKLTQLYTEYLIWVQVEAEDPIPAGSVRLYRTAISSLLNLIFNWKLREDPQILGLQNFWNKKNPQMARYLEVWHAGILLNYFDTTIPVEPDQNPAEFYLFLIDKALALIAFFCLLRPVELA
jgi:hypothetical protein